MALVCNTLFEVWLDPLKPPDFVAVFWIRDVVIRILLFSSVAFKMP
jgi:hypothetical protein